MRLRAGKAGSGKGAARMIAQAVSTARAAGVHRPDPGPRRLRLRQQHRDGRLPPRRCPVFPGPDQQPGVDCAIATIDEDAWTPVNYPGAVRDPDTGTWISDAEVAEITYTAFASTPDPITARLIVRRVKDARFPDALFPVWRYHPFFTNTDLPVADADITHRQHAIIETVFADLIDGPLAHIPSGRFGANCAWVLCAAIAHNLLRAAGVLAAAGTPSPAAPPCGGASSTSPPDWPARNADRSCTYPATGPGHSTGLRYGTTPSDAHPHSL